MSNLYDLLQKIKQRPALYLGKRSLSHLHVFLDAYTFARRELGIETTEQERNFEDFQDWIELKFNQTDTQSWSRIILFYSEDESDALEKFFDLFEEFSQNSIELDTEKSKKSIASSIVK